MIDHINTSRITCPHCGMDWDDSYFIKDGWEDHGEQACSECGESFKWQIDPQTFTTQKMEAATDGKHQN